MYMYMYMYDVFPGTCHVRDHSQSHLISDALETEARVICHDVLLNSAYLLWQLVCFATAAEFRAKKLV